MNKKEIINILNKFNFNNKIYAVTSESAMVLLGIIGASSSVKVLVDEEMLIYLKQNYSNQINDKELIIHINNFKICFYIGSFSYDDIVYINSIPVLNEKKLKEFIISTDSIDRINNYINLPNLNSLALAYLGDSVYETYIRKFLIDSNITKAKDLQLLSIKYVSAKAQTKYLQLLLSNKILTKTEQEVYLIARNHKCNHKPKNCDIITYKHATGFEAIIGFLYLKNNIERIEDIINYIIGR